MSLFYFEINSLRIKFNDNNNNFIEKITDNIFYNIIDLV